MPFFFIMLVSAFLMSCGFPSTSRLQEKIDSANEASRLGVPLTFTPALKDLPLEGNSLIFVWSGNWWPFSKGGTLETMRKYDLAVGGAGKAEAWEGSSIKGAAHIDWAGHCNGLAAAGMNEPAPRKPVDFQGQHFTVEDVQALLVEKWSGVSRIALVGRRCQALPVIDDLGRVTSAGCRDINPGALHVLLGNMLGLHHKPFVDIGADAEVWNYPVEGYKTTIAAIDGPEAQRLTQIAHAESYLWNPEATEFRAVKIDLRLSNGQRLAYEYVLELTEGRIIGGEWTGTSRLKHPDFAWTTALPELENPYLNMAVIDQIARLAQ